MTAAIAATRPPPEGTAGSVVMTSAGVMAFMGPPSPCRLSVVAPHPAGRIGIVLRLAFACVTQGAHDVACGIREEAGLVFNGAGGVMAGVAHDGIDVGRDVVEDFLQMLGPLLDVSPACPETYEMRGAELGELVEQVRVVELDAGRPSRIGGAGPADRAGARIVDSGVRGACHCPPPGPRSTAADWPSSARRQVRVSPASNASRDAIIMIATRFASWGVAATWLSSTSSPLERVRRRSPWGLLIWTGIVSALPPV